MRDYFGLNTRHCLFMDELAAVAEPSHKDILHMCLFIPDKRYMPYKKIRRISFTGQSRQQPARWTLRGRLICHICRICHVSVTVGMRWLKYDDWLARIVAVFIQRERAGRQ